MTRTLLTDPAQAADPFRALRRGSARIGWALAVGVVAASLLGGCAASAPAAPAPSPLAAVAPVSPPRDFDAEVRLLAHTDFAVRARASRALVAGGASALPALGRAGDLPVEVAGGLRVSATRAVLATIMTDVSADALDRALRAPWPNVRRAAAEELGRRDRWGAIPALIAGLDDPERDVRAAAAAALRRLTNNFFGYRAQARRTARRAAADRWRTWWSLEGRAKAAERERGPQAEAPRRP